MKLLSLEKKCPHKKACSVPHSSVETWANTALDVLGKPPFFQCKPVLSFPACVQGIWKMAKAALGTA
jgi:hypothetical protein